MRRQHNHQPNKDRKRNNFKQFNSSKNRFSNRPNKLKTIRENNKEQEEKEEKE